MKYWSRHISIFMVLVMAVVCGSALIEPTVVRATEYASGANYQLEQPILGQTRVDSVTAYIILIYKFGTGLVGIIATVLIMFGGYRWVASAGNEQTISSAKETIVAAVSGLIIVLLSFSILTFINPQLTKLSFNVQKLDPTNKGIDATKFPPCTDGAFVGKDCTALGDSPETGKCEDPKFTCGEPLLNLTDGTYCRAITCTGTGETCSRHPLDVSEYSCQITYCAGTTTKCADKTSDQVEYRKCVCNTYGEASGLALNAETSGGSPPIPAGANNFVYGFSFDNLTGEGNLRLGEMICNANQKDWPYNNNKWLKSEKDCRAIFDCGITAVPTAGVTAAELVSYGASWATTGTGVVAAAAGPTSIPIAVGAAGAAGWYYVFSNVYAAAANLTLDYQCVPSELLEVVGPVTAPTP